MSINEIECKVHKILMFRARQGLGAINYKSLAQLVGLDTDCFFTKWLMPILNALRRLDHESKKTKTPRLSALVVCTNTGLPGKGFWQNTLPFQRQMRKELCQQLHGAEVNAVLEHFSPLSLRQA